MTRRELIATSVGAAAASVLAGSVSRVSAKPSDNTTVQIGQLVGAEFVSSRNKFFLYATEPNPQSATSLFADDIVTLARASAFSSFAFSLEPRGEFMEIQYFSALDPSRFPASEQHSALMLKQQIERNLTGVFAFTTAQFTLQFCDRVLKDAGHGRLPADLNLGPSQLRICGKELYECLENIGCSLEDYQIPYVLFHDFEIATSFDGFKEVGVWFDGPKVVVKAATRGSGKPPKCADEFVESYTSFGIPRLMRHPVYGPEYGRLIAILILHKIFFWGSNLVFAPIDFSVLASYRTREVKSSPIRIRSLPIVVSAPGRQSKYVKVRGGIQFLSQPSEFSRFQPAQRNGDISRGPENLEIAAPARSASHRVPPFHVTRQILGRRTLLMIDISNILFGGR